MMNIHAAARELGRGLCGRVPHVVGVSIRRSDPDVPELVLFVDIDASEAEPYIPRVFEGHEVRVRLVAAPPRFGSDRLPSRM